MSRTFGWKQGRPTNTDTPSALSLARQLYELGGVEFGTFTVGRTTVDSPIYVNPRRLITLPAALREATRLVVERAELATIRRHNRSEPFELVAGVPFGGLQLATGVSLATEMPLVYVRPPSRGGALQIEGRFLPGQHVLLVDDLITTGGSVIESAEALRAEGLVVREVIALVDRDQGASRRVAKHGLNLMSILTFRAMLNYFMSEQWINEAQYRECLAYIESHQV